MSASEESCSSLSDMCICDGTVTPHFLNKDEALSYCVGETRRRVTECPAKEHTCVKGSCIANKVPYESIRCRAHCTSEESDVPEPECTCVGTLPYPSVDTILEYYDIHFYYYVVLKKKISECNAEVHVCVKWFCDHHKIPSYETIGCRCHKS